MAVQLELSEPPPEGTVMLGWDSSPIAFSDGAGLFRISHPAGSPQAYSAHVVDTSRPTCTSWPRCTGLVKNSLAPSV